jgi:hypothetical protein
LRDLGCSANAQPAAELGDDSAVLRQAARNLIAAVQQAMAQRDLATLQASVFHCPYGPRILAEPFDRRFRYE